MLDAIDFVGHVGVAVLKKRLSSNGNRGCYRLRAFIAKPGHTFLHDIDLKLIIPRISRRGNRQRNACYVARIETVEDARAIAHILNFAIDRSPDRTVTRCGTSRAALRHLRQSGTGRTDEARTSGRQARTMTRCSTTP